MSASAVCEAIWRLLDRDLTAMQQEIALYPSDDALWHVPDGIANSGGTLALHVAGNLQHFFGAILGSSGYVRNREREFSARGLSRVAVATELEVAQREVAVTLAHIDPARLREPYPIRVLDVQLDTMTFLLHLCTHLTYHLGQIDYHRRITTGMNSTAHAVHIPALVDPAPDSTPT
jgi:hypothetical protein